MATLGKTARTDQRRPLTPRSTGGGPTSQTATGERGGAKAVRSYRNVPSRSGANVPLSTVSLFISFVLRRRGEDQEAGGNHPRPDERAQQRADHHARNRPAAVSGCFFSTWFYSSECIHLRPRVLFTFRKLRTC